MSDKERFEEWLRSVGIKPECEDAEAETILSVKEGCSARVQGYAGFYTEYSFDASGTLLSMGAYE